MVKTIQAVIGVYKYKREHPCPICKKEITIIENQNLNLKIERCGCGVFKRRIQL